MKALTSAGLAAILVFSLLTSATSADAGLIVNAPIDVIGNLSVRDFANNGYMACAARAINRARDTRCA